MSLAVGFVGERLIQARKARALMATDLSDIVDVSSQSISKYENGHQTPRREVVSRIAQALNLPEAFFYRKMMTEDVRPVFWRSKLTAQTVMLDRANVRLDWFKEIVDYLEQFFVFPQLDLPTLEFGKDPLDLSSDEIERLANDVRAYWGIHSGPIPNCLENIEESGILVTRVHVRAEKVDACSQWSDSFGIPFIALSRDKASAVRQRFDAMHELCHILLHGRVTPSQLNNRQTYKLLEKQANEFAGFMLLPERDFLDELYAPTLDGMLSIKERWGVSVGAMISRCRALDILSDDATKRMWMNYTRRGWRKGEPLDGKMEKEVPYLIKRSFEMLIEEGVRSPEQIVSELPFPVEELEEIADLEQGTLGAKKRVRAEPQLKDEVRSSGNVVSIFDRKK